MSHQIFYLQENMQHDAYRNSPHTLQALEDKTGNTVLEIMKSKLKSYT
jgi:hypothetical protein